ncbi:MAG: hypothetical protein EOO01_02250 [Chitinophagaceae bacterium]|nr:MAG: hypothetical protein EOO01_02250 [Chitinophagaceae bacterium]
MKAALEFSILKLYIMFEGMDEREFYQRFQTEEDCRLFLSNATRLKVRIGWSYDPEMSLEFLI